MLCCFHVRSQVFSKSPSTVLQLQESTEVGRDGSYASRSRRHVHKHGISMSFTSHVLPILCGCEFIAASVVCFLHIHSPHPVFFLYYLLQCCNSILTWPKIRPIDIRMLLRATAVRRHNSNACVTPLL